MLLSRCRLYAAAWRVVPSGDKEDTTVIMQEIIEGTNIIKLFMDMMWFVHITCRIIEMPDLSMNEDGAEDLLVEIQKQLKKRQWE